MVWFWGVFDRSIKKPVYLEVRPNQKYKSFYMPQSCHNSDLGINFLTEISPHEVSWDEHRSDAESVKILYNYSVVLSKYADRINGCSGILKFGVNPDEEN